MTTNSFGTQLNSLNDVDEVNPWNVKTVECRIKKTYEKLAATEANIFLFTKLKALDLATNDISNFIQKQTLHKRVQSDPDLRVQRVAMQSKLADVLVFARRLRRERDSLKKRLEKKYSFNKSNQSEDKFLA